MQTVSYHYSALLHGIGHQSMACGHVQASAATSAAPAQTLKAADTVREFYSCYNAGNVDGILELMADDCEYHDLALYQEPHRGKEEVRKFFENVRKTVPGDLDFVLEKVSSDTSCVGVQW